MSETQLKTGYPEPVPSASQLASLPFASAIAGYIANCVAPERLRVVMHRIINRDGAGYIQQLSPYLGSVPYNPAEAGRILPVTAGIVGRAITAKSVVRTRHYNSIEELIIDLKADMVATGENRSIDCVAKSYLAIPMLSDTESAVTVLYADTHTPNVFAQNELLSAILSMCDGYCAFINHLNESPLEQIVNFPMEPAIPVKDKPTLYARLQEVVAGRVPRFDALKSFNFEIRP